MSKCLAAGAGTGAVGADTDAAGGADRPAKETDGARTELIDAAGVVVGLVVASLFLTTKTTE